MTAVPAFRTNEPEPPILCRPEPAIVSFPTPPNVASLDAYARPKLAESRSKRDRFTPKPKLRERHDLHKNSPALDSIVVAPSKPTKTADTPKQPFAFTVLLADSALRPPDWRWQRADLYRQHYASRRQKLWRAARRDGVGALLNFQRRLAKCFDDVMRSKLAAAEPHLCEAYTLSRLPPDGPLRLLVECLILADACCADIASETSLSIETIAQYERLFFDVRSRLATPSLVTHLLGAGGRLTEPHQVIRFLAFKGGKHVAKPLIQGLTEREPAVSPQQVSGFLHADTVQQLQTKVTIISHLLDVSDPKVAKRVLKTWIDLERLQLRRERSRTEHGRLHAITPRRATRAKQVRKPRGDASEPVTGRSG